MTPCPINMSPAQCQQLLDDTREIKTAIVGNMPMGQKGIVQKLEEYEVKFADQDKRLKRLERRYVYLTGATGAVVVIYTVLKDFIQH